jgi:2-polyprenyl-6-methoxyphenol hydroxylase-like FAD-dependent oxidoreductase
MAKRSRTKRILKTRCCIAGGGPAGMMLGFLLARAGVDVIVLEKHKDFFRDFRGDTIHPSTLELMHELGLLKRFLRLPHDEVVHVRGVVGDTPLTIADFSHLPTHCKFLAFMPQWDFLDFLARAGKRYPRFRLMMEAEATGLVQRKGRVLGVRAKTARGPVEIHAPLTVAADGRHSTLRAQAKLAADDLGAPMDVLWLHLSRRPGDPNEPLGRIAARGMLVMLDRGDYWQCAFIIAKGSYDKVRAGGLERLRAEIARIAPMLAGRIGEIKTWDDVKLLTVAVDRLREWSQPGLLCIGDAAHAMSPIGGVGINLAIQDAVAAANLLWQPLRDGALDLADLAAVQKRRMWPTRMTQRMQVIIQNRIIRRVLASDAKPRLHWMFQLLNSFPILQRIPARLIGIGFRPEHVRTPEARRQKRR